MQTPRNWQETIELCTEEPFLTLRGVVVERGQLKRIGDIVFNRLYCVNNLNKKHKPIKKNTWDRLIKHCKKRHIIIFEEIKIKEGKPTTAIEKNLII